MALSNVTGMLFAMIGFGEREGEVRVNFGQSKFEYDIDAHDWTIEERAASIRARLLGSVFDSLSLYTLLRTKHLVGRGASCPADRKIKIKDGLNELNHIFGSLR